VLELPEVGDDALALDLFFLATRWLSPDVDALEDLRGRCVAFDPRLDEDLEDEPVDWEEVRRARLAVGEVGW